MPPKSAIRATGKPKPQPQPKVTLTPADRVRLQWATFETEWLSAQRKELEVKKAGKLQELRHEMESTKKTIPKGFHPTLMREYEERKQGVVKEVEFELVLRSRDEWEERLNKAGLNAEDWDPMTSAEQETVRKALAGDSGDEEYPTHVIPEAVNNYPSHQNQATIVQQANIHLDVPAFSKWAPDAERAKSLSPLPDLLDGFRSQTPNRVPPTPPALFGGTKPLGTRYTGPVLIEENRHESLEDADFAKFKMTIREQMITEFHEEAARQEIMLVRKEHEVKLEADAVKALLSGHELNMEELRRQKEDKRKAMVDAERTKRKAEIRRRNFTSKGTVPDLAAQILSHPKGQSKLSMQVKQPPVFETQPVPEILAEEEPIPADVPASSNQSAVGKTETKKQKKAGKNKKTAASRAQPGNSKADAPSEKQEDPEEIVRPPEQKTQAKPRGIVKDTSFRFDMKPTVEEISDEEADSWVEPRVEAAKLQASRPAGIFAEPQRAPSTRPFGSDSEDNRIPRFAPAPTVSKSKKMKEPVRSSLSKQQNEATKEQPMFSNGDADQGYWDIINGGMGVEPQQGDASESTSSMGGKHALWSPPVFNEDSGDDGDDLFNSFAFGGMGPADDVPSVPWAGNVSHHKNVWSPDKNVWSPGQNPIEKNLAAKVDARFRNAPTRKGGGGKETSV